MAQLPPKIPSMAQNWPAFPHHQRIPLLPTTAPPPPATAGTEADHQQPPWVDEFIDFASARRGAHRRSMSDSTASLISFDEERHNSLNSPILHGGGNGGGFDGFDDEQLMSMFSEDTSGGAPMGNSNPSTPSDQNSNNEETKPISTEPPHQPPPPPLGEAESSCKSDQHPCISPPSDPFIDPKRVKRILANRQSAQRSRVRKLQYISELERSVTTLQSEVSALSPRVAFLDHHRLVLNVDNGALKQRIAALAQDKIFKDAFLDHHRLVLNVDNGALKQRIAALAQDKIFKDAHQEALKKDIERLRKIYHHQIMKTTGGAAVTDAATPTSDNPGCTERSSLSPREWEGKAVKWSG
ncbi:hypothetical protein Nepgr_027404 [Nepenthes gracilis]|uniref:BZIP domain-containing protein n=1 Tax=Nepenthes gracilis TaxID=150966 RepID=A0AAD3Y3I1_NEPGR|nr:hypothetical protein Nepgr_027404 [Nepenthes gracilis]